MSVSKFLGVRYTKWYKSGNCVFSFVCNIMTNTLNKSYNSICVFFLWVQTYGTPSRLKIEVLRVESLMAIKRWSLPAQYQESPLRSLLLEWSRALLSDLYNTLGHSPDRPPFWTVGTQGSAGKGPWRAVALRVPPTDVASWGVERTTDCSLAAWIRGKTFCPSRVQGEVQTVPVASCRIGNHVSSWFPHGREAVVVSHGHAQDTARRPTWPKPMLERYGLTWKESH